MKTIVRIEDLAITLNLVSFEDFEDFEDDFDTLVSRTLSSSQAFLLVLDTKKSYFQPSFRCRDYRFQEK